MFKLSCLVVILTSILELGTPHPELTQITSKYHMSTVVLELVQAYAVCKRNGYTLLTEKSAEETTEINAAIEAAGQLNRVLWLSAINASRGELDSAYVWLDSGEELDYTNWKDGEPISTVTCIMRNSITLSPPAQWETTGCSNQYWFICQTS